MACYSMRMAMNVLQLADRLRTEADAYLYLEELRWNGRPVCPHCGSVGEHYFLKPSNGRSRKTRTGATSERRVWKCRDCRKQFSVLTGTIFHGTKIPVRTWCFLVFEMAASKNGISAREVERKYGLCPRSAWFALHRLREAMKRGSAEDLLAGRVIADETRYGGKPKNRHGHDPKEHVQRTGEDKITIMALVSRETGEVRSRIVPNIKGPTLRAAIAEQVDMPNTDLHTDALRTYQLIADSFASHGFVNHEDREYVRDDVTTNHAETYFSQLKRSLDGTHHHVSREHLERYLAEFDFRYSTCNDTDTERMGKLVSQTGGRRLAYQQAG
jgi:transposase-like protein